MQTQHEPVQSRGEKLQKPCLNRQQTQRQSRQKQEQEPRNKRSRCQSPGQDRNSRQLEHQETTGRPKCRRAASLEDLVGDINDKRNH
ncbi:hypothetical protein TNCV_3592371 [Trichonephila clavipes]|nr:hypothetical protein TNCV_3592371 [Trichonephila clavipes]